MVQIFAVFISADWTKL